MGSGGRGTNYRFLLLCDSGDVQFDFSIPVSGYVYELPADSVGKLLVAGGRIVKRGLDNIDREKYCFPVIYGLGNDYEIGNDSYEYARFDPIREYDNFGLNVVYLSSKDDDNINISWKTIPGKSMKMQAPAGIQDTFLVYSNINSKFFDGWHVCPDSISTPENFAKIEEGGYGYIFRGKIYSKEETEKYWNIIEQYKLRESGK